MKLFKKKKKKKKHTKTKTTKNTCEEFFESS